LKAIVNGKIILKDTILENSALLYTDKIEAIVSENLIPSDAEIIDAKGGYVAAGLIDLHIHGYLNKDVCDGEEESIRTISKGLLENGVMMQVNASFFNGRFRGAKALNMSLLNNKGTINVYVMAVAWASEAINTSSQLLIKYISLGEEAHKKTIDFMKNQTVEALMGYIMNQTERVTSTTITSEIIAELGDEAMTDAILMESIIKDSYKYIQAAIAKNKLKVNGMHSHMMFDLTYALTEGRLNNILGITPEGFVEAYSADINKRYAKEIAEIENNKEMTKEEQRLALQDLLSGVVIKYPTAMSKEYEIVVYLTKQQVLNRIAESNISNTDKAELKDYFLNTPWGCTVYAPINAM
jgi:hypothetical protein